MSPLHEISRGKDSKRKQSATVLISKKCLAKKRLKFLKKGRRKTGRRVCKKKSRNYEPESGSEYEPEVASSSEDICTECEEPYATTEQNCVCIRYVDCSK
jgi:hypothetical protein